MTQYNTLNLKLSNSEINHSKSGINNCTEAKFCSNVVDDFNEKNNFPHKLLLTNT